MRSPSLLLITLLLCACNGEPTAPVGGTAKHTRDGPQYFRDVTAEVGLDYVHEMTLSGTYAPPEILPPGCAVFDADGDGLLDLYFTNAGKGPDKGARNRLYRRTEEGRYVEVEGAAGLDDPGYGFGVAVGDIDNDGDLDVYVGNWGRDALFLNEAGRFRDVTKTAGIVGDSWTTSVAFLDYDLDGFLDIYVVHYVDVDLTIHCAGNDSRRDYCAPQAFDGVADTLYRNRGDGTFEDVSARAGLARIAAPGLGVQVTDFNGDGRPDVYVCNDGEANQAWINRPDGLFMDDSLLLGVAFNGQGESEASMGVAIGDVNGDGLDDIFVTHLEHESNTLYVRRGKRASKERMRFALNFADASARSGMTKSSLGFTGFGTAMFDVDHDGDLDVAAANGRVERGEPLAGVDMGPHWTPYAQPNQFLLNDGAGVFRDASHRTDTFGGLAEISRALAVADLDGDGDLDMVLGNCDGPARILDNVAPKTGHWLGVRAVDPRLRRDVYGARVIVHAGGRVFPRTVGPASSYLCSSQITLHFGLGDAEAIDRVEVIWPGGTREAFGTDGVDRVVTFERGKGSR